MSDEELLSVRFCDLELSLEGSSLEPQIEQLYAELKARGITFRPHVWLAEEWFSPDGVPGIAVPFYLADPRLERLERSIMKEAEGADPRYAMRILRHEAGHALDNAFRLRRRKLWREVFGPASLRYPERYKARPGSRRFVHHLGEWYAQSHPTEDFAETFAVWLMPNSDWKKTYADWPAFHKLEVVDALMQSVRGVRPPVRNRQRIEPIERDRRTLAEHYRARLARQRSARLGLADDLLLRVFSRDPPPRRASYAANLLRACKTQLTEGVAETLGLTPYSVEQILRLLIERCETLQLYVHGSRRDAVHHARWMIERVAQAYSQGETPQLLL
jgi:hypothetical protein